MNQRDKILSALKSGPATQWELTSRGNTAQLEKRLAELTAEGLIERVSARVGHDRAVVVCDEGTAVAYRLKGAE